MLKVYRFASFLFKIKEHHLTKKKCTFQNIIGRCKEIKDNFESRGPTKTIEYGAYEARLFCEMLLKGSIIILEVMLTYFKLAGNECHESYCRTPSIHVHKNFNLAITHELLKIEISYVYSL